MLDHVHGRDLASLVHHDLHLHRLEARYLVHVARSGGLLNSFCRSRLCRRSGLHLDTIRSSGLLERVVDRIGGQRHASLHIDLRSRQILAHQRIKARINQVSTKARRLIVRRNSNGHDLAICHSNFHGELIKALDRVRISRNLRTRRLQRAVNRIRGQRHASLHINRCTSNVLTHQRIKYRSIRNQVSAKARCLIVLQHLHRHNLTRIVHGNLDLHRAKASHVVGVGGHNRLSIAGSSSGSSENRILVARLRRDT